MEGESHLSAQEITSYEEDMSVLEENLTDDLLISEDDDSLDPITLSPQ